MSVLAPHKVAAETDRARSAALPVIEIFGPTVQGEGPDMGRPAYFVRFGGCDFRCTWCDSMHAVEPALVRASATAMSAPEIADRLGALEAGPLVDILHESGYEVAVETQGSRWREWLGGVDRLVVSPKGPSSGMGQDR